MRTTGQLGSSMVAYLDYVLEARPQRFPPSRYSDILLYVCIIYDINAVLLN